MTVAEPALAKRLQAELTGRVIEPGDAEYDSLRALSVGGKDRRPAIITRPAHAADVARAIELARESGGALSVRAGGHSGAGHGVLDDAVVIDLRSMRGIEVDAQARTAWADAGLTAGEYTAEIGEHGLATGFGDTGSVGISGITLGGGVGFLSRLHGLTIDSLLAAELVTADGDILTVDADSDADLFWALRGGGGNFGVVTRFKFRLSEVPRATGGMLMLPATAEVVASVVKLAEQAPDELSTILNVMPAPPMPFVPPEHHGKLIVMALMCCAAPAEEAARILAPFRDLVEPLVDTLKPGTYPEMFPPEPEGDHPAAAMRTGFIEGLDRDAAAGALERLRTSDAPMRVVQLRVLGGAIARVPADATAYAHRNARILTNVAAFYEAPDQKPARQAWVDAVIAELRPRTGAAYVNFLADEGADRVRAAYPGSTWDRLAAIKARLDPDNVFRSNQNIPPA